MKKLILFMLFSLSSFHAIARDAIVLKLKDCRFLKGFILSIEENINFIDTSGRIISVSEDEISLILTYVI